MKILQFDLFSSEFYFDLGAQSNKKGTFQGVILSFLGIIGVFSYFIYLLYLYSSNLIDPKFRSQSFIMNQNIEIPLSQDLFSFSFSYNSSMSVETYQKQQNKTYLVYIAYLYYRDEINQIVQFIFLDVVPCTGPSLFGMNCIDMSKVSNYTLIQDNSMRLSSLLYINIYGCNDIDNIKTTIPENCAQQSEIDNLINLPEAELYLKLKTQQYNTTSKQIQTNYRNLYSFGLSNQLLVNTIRTQKQETQVSTGLLFQSKEMYSSPIQYDLYSQSFDRQVSLNAGYGPYIQVNISMDEIVQQFQIQYPSITEILALVNSIAFVFVIFRIIGRYISQRLIYQDIFMDIFRNIFQVKYQQIIKHNNLMQEKNEIFLQTQMTTGEENTQSIQENSNVKEIIIPNFSPKFRDYVDKNQQNNLNLDFIRKQNSPQTDEIKQNDDSIFTRSQTSSIQKRNRSRFENNTNFNNIALCQQNEFLSSPQSKQQRFQNDESLKKSKSSSIKQSIEIQSIDQKMDTQAKDNLIEKANKKMLKDAIKQKLEGIYNNSFKQSIQNSLFKFRFFKAKEKLSLIGYDEKSIQKIHEQVKRSLNIHELYKDIIYLKKAIMMLLNEDQLAALQLVSLTDHIMNQDQIFNDLKIKKKKNIDNLNFFEKQFLIMQSEQLQSKYIKKFFEKFQKGSYLSEIDHRIMSSIIKKKESL